MTEQPITKVRVVLPDGNGVDFSPIHKDAFNIGQTLQAGRHKGLNGWTVYRIEDCLSTRFICVN